MSKTIALMATLDTKGAEIGYMRECVESRGHEALVIDTGLMNAPATRADISSEEIAKCGGTSLHTLRQHHDREESARVIAAAVAGGTGEPGNEAINRVLQRY